MPNLKPRSLPLATEPEPIVADMIARIDALDDYLLVPAALAGAGLNLRAMKVVLALHERGGAEYSLGVVAVTIPAEDWKEFAEGIGCSERTATEAVRDAKRANVLDVKYLDNGDRVFYVKTGEATPTRNRRIDALGRRDNTSRNDPVPPRCSCLSTGSRSTLACRTTKTGTHERDAHFWHR